MMHLPYSTTCGLLWYFISLNATMILTLERRQNCINYTISGVCDFFLSKNSIQFPMLYWMHSVAICTVVCVIFLWKEILCIMPPTYKTGLVRKRWRKHMEYNLESEIFSGIFYCHCCLYPAASAAVIGAIVGLGWRINWNSTAQKRYNTSQNHY